MALQKMARKGSCAAHGLGKMKPTKPHGGKRKGAGRKPALLPAFSKKLRATDKEREEFMSYLTGDAVKDFEILIHALAIWRSMAGLPVKRK